MTISSVGVGDHHKISPTARVVAYCRSFSDIPYAKEVSEAVRGEDAARTLYCEDFDFAVRHAGPFLEARYKCFNRFTAVNDNVLELAIGTSIERGLSISNNIRKMYIGTDLPEMLEEARWLCCKIGGERTNHRLEVANVLSYEELNAASSAFGQRRNLLVICEGLWGYLSFEEQAVAAENIRRILECYGGQWVTPEFFDIESLDHCIVPAAQKASAARSRIRKRLADLTGRVVEQNLFASKHEAFRFFHQLGFEVKQYPMIDDVFNMTSLAKLWEDQERGLYEQVLRKQTVSVMSLR